MTDNLNSLKTDVEILKRDISAIQGFSSKIDDAIEKMAEVSNNISKMLIVHENRLQNNELAIDGLKASMSERKNDFEKQIELIHKRITDMKDENHTERQKYHQELLAAMKGIADGQTKLEERINVLERWKWVVIGGSSAVGFIVSMIPWDKIFGV